MLNHVMVDLETLGNKPSAVFISIGAVVFDPFTGAIDRQNSFYRRIDWESASHRQIDVSTVKWWMKQSAAAISEILQPGQEYLKVLNDFSSWFPKGGVIWGNGATFDVSILSDAYQHSPPWQFWNVRDVRTVVDMAQGIVERESCKFVGVKHNALDDAIFQAEYVSKMVMALRNGR